MQLAARYVVACFGYEDVAVGGIDGYVVGVGHALCHGRGDAVEFVVLYGERHGHSH